MNMIWIIGNLTNDPDMRTVTTQTGGEATVTAFTVAVNRHAGERKFTDFFRVSVWGKQAENAKQYLAKGRKVSIVGAVSARAYTGPDGSARASMEISQVERMEFLTPKAGWGGGEAQQPDGGGFVEDHDDDELPF